MYPAGLTFSEKWNNQDFKIHNTYHQGDTFLNIEILSITWKTFLNSLENNPFQAYLFLANYNRSMRVISAINWATLEDHIVFSQCSSFISENILHLPQFFWDI